MAHDDLVTHRRHCDVFKAEPNFGWGGRAGVQLFPCNCDGQEVQKGWLLRQDGSGDTNGPDGQLDAPNASQPIAGPKKG